MIQGANWSSTLKAKEVNIPVVVILDRQKIFIGDIMLPNYAWPLWPVIS